MNTNNPYKYLILLTAAFLTSSAEHWYWLHAECKKRGIILLCLSNNGRYLIPVICVPKEVLQLRIDCALKWRSTVSKKAQELAKKR